MEAPNGDAAGIPTTAISDALDKLSINGVLDGVYGLPGSGLTVGIARTALIVESRQPGLPGLSDVFDSGVPGDFLAFGWAAGTVTASVFGGLAAKRARLRGFVGLCVDGWVRDVDEFAGEFPVWCRGATPRTGRGRLAVQQVAHPIVIGKVLVTAGDTIVADGTGVCVIPSARRAEVLEEAASIVRRDEAVERGLGTGVSFDQAHHDAAQTR
jgi:4-hydroxy-4-methyl-2-oxoglutarate aldolase